MRPMQWQFDPSITDPKARIQVCIDDYKNDTEFDGAEAIVMRNLAVVSAHRSPNPARDGYEAHALMEMQVVPKMCNVMGNMFGGSMASLADMATTMATAPVVQPGFWEFGGVSRTLNLTYLAPTEAGKVLRVECFLRSIGKRLSVTQCSITDRDSGKLLALAEHGKAAFNEQIPKSKI